MCNIPRFEETVIGDSNMDHDINGRWILYDDHAAEVARLNEQVRALAAEGKAYQGVTFRLISMLSLSGYTSVRDSMNPAEALLFDAEKALDSPVTDAILRDAAIKELRQKAANIRAWEVQP